MTINEIALDMDRDFNTAQWGIHDGSAGLEVYIIKSDNWNEIKLNMTPIADPVITKNGTLEIIAWRLWSRISFLGRMHMSTAVQCRLAIIFTTLYIALYVIEHSIMYFMNNVIRDDAPIRIWP